MEVLKPYPKYKNSEYDWLGQVPLHWEERYLFQCATEQNLSNKTIQHQNLLSLSYGRIKRKDIKTTTGLLPATFDNYQIVNKGNIILRLTDLQNDHKSLRTGLVTETGIITSAYLCLKCSEDTIAEFLQQLLHSYDIRKLFYGLGGGLRQSCGFQDLKKIRIYLPPRSEQIQIANYLDYKVALINKFIKDKKKEIILLKEQKQAEINQAVTRGINPNAKMKDSGISWIGEIPEHWDKRYLFQLCEEQKQSNKSIKNQNLLSLSYGRIINKDINSTAGLLPASFDTYQIVNNGNIILRLTDLQNDHKSLRVGLATQTGIITSAYTCLKVKDTINPEYLYLALHTYDILKVFYGMGGGLRQSIGFKEIRKLIFNLPLLDEQQEIITHIKSIDDRIEIAVSAIENQIKLIQEYKTSLISDVVTGKVDVRNIAVQNTEDEPEEDVEEMEETEEIENSEE